MLHRPQKNNSYGKYYKTTDTVSSLSVIYNITLGYNSTILYPCLNIKAENAIGMKVLGWWSIDNIVPATLELYGLLFRIMSVKPLHEHEKGNYYIIFLISAFC